MTDLSPSISDWINKVKIHITDEDLQKIPTHKNFITVSNRPIGIIEEILIAQILLKKQSKIAFLNNIGLLNEKDFYIKYVEGNSLLDFKKLLQNKFSVSTFPVGNTSDFSAKGNSLSDSVWDKTVVKKIYQNDAPIIPIYISINNEAFKKMQALFLNQKMTYDLAVSIIEYNGLDVSIRIGKPIKKEKYNFNNINQFGRFLRAKLYSLGSKLKVENFYEETQIATEIVKPVNELELEAELNSISDTNKIGTHLNFDIYLAKAKKIPLAINEIGRLREETFRKVGEGTNKQIDLDEYDLHYLHLFIYDRNAKKIAGAYRLGDGKYIMETMGKKGFYIRSLFKMGKAFNPYLSSSLELGRSFIVESYQNQRWPLFLLWQGITYYITNSHYLKYIIGPVSISSSYSKVSKSFIVSYIMQYHWDEKLAKYIKPKTMFKPDFEDIDYQAIIDSSGNSLKLLDEIIEDVDPLHNKVPVLLKKYFSKEARIIGFNLDPDFNDALDGFMITNISKIPLEELKAFKAMNKKEYAY